MFNRSLIATLSLLLSWGSALASHATGGLQGPAFSDPDKTVPVESAWRDAPVVYDDWAKGADLAVSLDQHLYPAFLPAIERFARDKGVRIAVQEGTCGISAGALTRKEVDMGGFCCPPGASDRLPGLRWHTIGIASLGLLVSRQNPVESVTLEQARQIFQGRVFNWSELPAAGGTPGPNWPVRPVTRLHCKDRPGHWRLLLDNEDLFGVRVMEVGNIADMMAQVAAERGAVGYEVLWNVGHYNVGDRVKPLAVDGHLPTDRQALARGDYPLYRTYNITTWQDGNPLADELADYLIAQTASVPKEFEMVTAAELRKAGWRFRGDELIGRPGN